jgi:hypothetical protein
VGKVRGRHPWLWCCPANIVPGAGCFVGLGSRLCAPRALFWPQKASSSLEPPPKSFSSHAGDSQSGSPAPPAAQFASARHVCVRARSEVSAALVCSLRAVLSGGPVLRPRPASPPAQGSNASGFMAAAPSAPLASPTPVAPASHLQSRKPKTIEVSRTSGISREPGRDGLPGDALDCSGNHA